MKFLGRIDPINWDDSGKAIAFALATPEGEDIILENPRYQDKLRRLVDRIVEVEGRVLTSPYGEKRLSITRLRRRSEQPYEASDVNEFNLCLPA